jgi:hypothetical protein
LSFDFPWNFANNEFLYLQSLYGKQGTQVAISMLANLPGMNFVGFLFRTDEDYYRAYGFMFYANPGMSTGSYGGTSGGGRGSNASPIDPDVAKAAYGFLDRLMYDKECENFFGGPAAAGMFAWMIGNNYVRVDPNGEMPTKTSGKGAYVAGQQLIYINKNGPFFSPIFTAVQGGGSHNFLADWQGQYRMPNMTVEMFRQIIIAHELAHIVGVIEGNDANNPSKQQRNTSSVINACFKDARPRSR